MLYLRRLLSLILASAPVLVFSGSIAHTDPPQCPEIWFAPLDQEFRPNLNGGGSVDYMDLFRPDAPWPNAASRVNVFNLNGWFIGHASDSDIQTAVSWLRQHRMKIATNLGLLTARETCGKGIEGYSSNYSLFVVSRLKRLGGYLDYIQMDEPLWFGHEPEAAPTACHLSIEQVAQNVASSSQRIRAIFPEVKIGDVEPISNFPRSDWLDHINDWASAYHTVTGQPLAFIAADVDWRKPWLQRARSMGVDLRQIGLRFGMIYNGSGRDKSDASWVTMAQQSFQTFEAEDAQRPDLAIFMSWMHYPIHVLPETSTTAMTHLINAYAEYRPCMR